jgi:hypothetical protein
VVCGRKVLEIGPSFPDGEEQQRIAENYTAAAERGNRYQFLSRETEPERCLLPSLPELVIIPPPLSAINHGRRQSMQSKGYCDDRN